MSTPLIKRIRMRISNAYLVQGDRAILVDTGSPGEADKVLAALARAGIAPQDLALILHTHGHIDHCGSTAELRRHCPAPTAIHPGDAPKMRSGSNGALHPTNLTGWLLKPFVDKPFPPAEPDLLAEEGFDLRPYGVRGRLVSTPGHTPGSITLLLESGEAFVGDLMMGGYFGGAFRNTRPGYHYFAEDLPLLRSSIRKLVKLAPARVYPGHGGVLDPADIITAFAKDIDFSQDTK